MQQYRIFDLAFNFADTHFVLWGDDMWEIFKFVMIIKV
jgi:hypothetical protein